MCFCSPLKFTKGKITSSSRLQNSWVLFSKSVWSKVRAATILDKINGKPRPLLPPKSRMGKWPVFALLAASSLIWGGWGFAVPFYFVQDCTAGASHARKACAQSRTPFSAFVWLFVRSWIYANVRTVLQSIPLLHTYIFILRDVDFWSFTSMPFYELNKMISCSTLLMKGFILLIITYFHEGLHFHDQELTNEMPI